MRTAVLSLFALALAAAPVAADKHKKTSGTTNVTWLGHAAFKIETPKGNVLYIDPWLTNPKNPDGKKMLKEIKKADLLLVSHGHFDHVGDTVAIAKKTGAKLVSTFDLGAALKTYGGFPEKQAGFDTQGNFGGTFELLGGEVKIRLVPAIHGSSFSDDQKELHVAGNPGGFVILIKGGPTLYHAGDTDVFGDMSLIGQRDSIDYLLAPIGGHFTMDPEGAAKAAKLVNAKHVVPMHFGTFPVLTGTPKQLESALKDAGSSAKVKTLSIGKTVTLK